MIGHLALRRNALLINGCRDYDAGMRHNLALGLSLSCVKEADDCSKQSISTISLTPSGTVSPFAVSEGPPSCMGSVIVPEPYMHSQAAMAPAHPDISVGGYVHN